MSKATCPHRLSRQRASTTAPWASCTATGSTEPRASISAASRLARAGDSFLSSCAKRGIGPAQGLDELGLGNLAEDRAQVVAIKETEVIDFDEVRQGSPPDRWGRVR